VEDYELDLCFEVSAKDGSGITEMVN